MEEKDEEKKPVDIEFYDRNANSENYENTIDFRWSDVKWEDEEILIRLTSLREK